MLPMNAMRKRSWTKIFVDKRKKEMKRICTPNEYAYRNTALLSKDFVIDISILMLKYI